jgi:cytochrome c
VEIRGQNVDNKWVLSKRKLPVQGDIVNRLWKNAGLALGLAVLLGTGVLLANAAAKTNNNTAANAAAVKRGKDVFQQKCSVCHYDNSDQKKIGPGLKGISKRGTFSVNGNKITDDSLRAWIENGDQLMPPFKDVLEAGQIKDVVAYVKTL